MELYIAMQILFFLNIFFGYFINNELLVLVISFYSFFPWYSFEFFTFY